MTAYLLYDDSLHSPEMRHEISEPVGDPVVFLEAAGRRIVIASMLEETTFTKREDVVDEFWGYHELGADELVADGSVPDHDIGSELVARALERAEVKRVSVPPTFRLHTADYLRARGVEVTVDAPGWSQRRRRKSPSELEGIERAQRAAEMAFVTAVRMLRAAEPTSQGRLRFEGEILTCELVREAMVQALLSQGAESEEIIVQSGDACLEGHELGSGPIWPDRSLIIDCFPRDRRSGAYSDMTRTLVVGRPSEELRRLHEHCRRALDIAVSETRPGRAEAHRKVSEYFSSQGFPTQLTHEGPGPLREGFYHSLGHGVGLEVHEKPSIGRRSDELVAGDVVALEPGLYFEGVGGVRLEDTVLVTDDGAERLTDPYPYDLEL